MKPLTFGVCMGGNEAMLEMLMRENAARFDEVNYVEIGVAYGQTLASMSAIMRDCSTMWRGIGIDLPDGYSLDVPTVKGQCDHHSLRLTVVDKPIGKVNPKLNEVTVYLKPSQELLRENWKLPIHLGLIDGCHGKPCVKADFECLNQFMPPGAIAVFHDFGEDSVGEPQPHCGFGDTLGACRDMGLLDGRYPGWKYRGTFISDKSKIGRDIGMFQKI